MAIETITKAPAAPDTLEVNNPADGSLIGAVPVDGRLSAAPYRGAKNR
jgi:hypothetical protein